jgi:hypothetical protein
LKYGGADAGQKALKIRKNPGQSNLIEGNIEFFFDGSGLLSYRFTVDYLSHVLQ